MGRCAVEKSEGDNSLSLLHGIYLQFVLSQTNVAKAPLRAEAPLRKGSCQPTG